MPNEGLDYRRAGFLRRMGGHGGEGKPSSAAVRASWNMLVREGLAETAGGLYRRTGEGEALLRDYDKGLAPEAVALLGLVRDQAQRVRGAWSLHPLVGAGLVGIDVRASGLPQLTPAGAEILALHGA